MKVSRVLIAALAAIAFAACRDDDGDNETAEPVATSSAVSTSTTLPEFPPARDDATLQQGTKTWAVVLAGAPTEESREFAPAIAAAKDAGYDLTGASGCDTGDGKALGRSDDQAQYTVSIYFETEDQARRALRAFRARGVTGGGVGEVTLFCLD